MSATGSSAHVARIRDSAVQFTVQSALENNSHTSSSSSSSSSSCSSSSSSLSRDAKSKADLNVKVYANQRAAFEAIDELNSCSVTEAAENATNVDDAEWVRYNVQCVFAEEYGFKGARKFLTATLENFFRYYCYELKSRKERHHYELIREQTPAKLYFDIEYAYGVAEGGSDTTDVVIDEEKERAMMDAFLLFVVGELRVDFKQELEGRSDSALLKQALVLKSCSPKKFSRHVIFNLRGSGDAGRLLVFRDAVQCGWYVEELCERLATREDCEALRALLYVRGELFVDQGVYTRNRCFRLIFSAKLNKSAVLVVADENAYPIKDQTNQSVDNKRSLFTESLIATGLAPSDYRFLTLPASLLASSESVGNPTASTLAPPPKRRKKRVSYGSSAPVLGGSSSDMVQYNLPSPFPRLDALIANSPILHQTPQVPEGYVKSCQYFPSTRHLIYPIHGNNYCVCVQRQHKSNKTYVCVNLDTCEYYQSCFDRDCSNSGVYPPRCRFPSSLIGEKGKDKEGKKN